MRSFDIALRPADPADCEAVFGWANDPEVRRQSFNPDPIRWSDHQRWFSQQITDPGRTLLIASVDGHPLGQIRFEITAQAAVLSYALVHDARGGGWSAPLLIAGVRHLRHTHPTVAVTGLVKADNTSSLASFDRAAFVQVQPSPNELTVEFRSPAGLAGSVGSPS